VRLCALGISLRLQLCEEIAAGLTHLQQAVAIGCAIVTR
jgi:hypothetical protein